MDRNAYSDNYPYNFSADFYLSFVFLFVSFKSYVMEVEKLFSKYVSWKVLPWIFWKKNLISILKDRLF